MTTACFTLRMSLIVVAAYVVAALPTPVGASSSFHARVVADTLRFEYKERHMGVVARVVVYAQSEQAARAASSAAFDRIAAIENAVSNYRQHSELSRLVSAASEMAHTVPVSVSSDLLRVLAAADSMWRASAGAFDPTVGPLTRLWARARRTGELPANEELEAARRRVGWKAVRVDASAKTVQILKAGIMVDPGGIAKGYACDEALRVLRASGLPRALVQIGGDIVAGDAPPGSDGWLVSGATQGGVDSLRVANAAVSTSGDSEQHVVVDGVVYSHIVDPRTGLGLTHRTAVTVQAPRGIVADALSTAVSVMGGEQGTAMAARLYPDAVIWYRIR